MPLPMVHLAIAVQLCQQHNKPLAPPFLLGSLAPDAIHMRANTTRDDKRVTHFLRPDQTLDEEQMASILARNGGASMPWLLFTAGYVAHVLTDIYWRERVAVPLRPSIPPELTSAERRALYYRETDYVDWDLYHHAPWRRAVWEALAQAELMAFTPLLTADEIDQWRTRTRHWFDQPPAQPLTAPRFFTPALVADFIDRATSWLSQELGRRGMLPDG